MSHELENEFEFELNYIHTYIHTGIQFENSCDVGVFSKLTNAYCLVAIGGSESFYRLFIPFPFLFLIYLFILIIMLLELVQINLISLQCI